MKLILCTLIVLVYNVFVILNANFKNTTLANTMQNNKYPISENIHKSFLKHISKNNQKLFNKYWEMKKQKLHLRINNDEFNSFFDGKYFIYGMCMVKYKNYIINLNPFSNNTGNSYFLKYKSEIFDFDVCKDVYTYNNRNGMFVDRYKDVIYAGDADEDKYFYVEEITKNIDLQISENKNQTNLKPKIYDESTDERIATLYEERTLKLKDEREKANKIKVEKTTKVQSLNLRTRKLSSADFIIGNVTVFLRPGDKCKQDPKFQNTIAYKFICDSSAKIPMILNANNFDPESCFNIIEIKTDKICIENLENFKVWYEKMGLHKKILAVLFIMIGAYFILYSENYREKSFLFSLGLSNIFALKALITDLNSSLFLVLILGLIVLLMCIEEKKEILNYWAFYMFAYFMSNFIFSNSVRFALETDEFSIEFYYYSVFFLVIYTFYLTSNFILQFRYFNLLFMTAIGTHFLLRGISIFYSNFPDERYIFLLLKHKEFAQYDRLFFHSRIGYSIAFISISISSMFIQLYIVVPIVQIVETYKADQAEKLRKLNEKNNESMKVDEKTNEEGENKDEIDADNYENSGSNPKSKNGKNKKKSLKPLVNNTDINSDIKCDNDLHSSKEENKNNYGKKENS